MFVRIIICFLCNQRTPLLLIMPVCVSLDNRYLYDLAYGPAVQQENESVAVGLSSVKLMT